LADLFAWRRDVRRFRSDPIDEETFNELLDLAATAPSVGLSQPWRFVIVDSPTRRAAVRAHFEACNAAALASQGSSGADYARLKLAGIDQAPRQFAVFCEENPRQGRGLGRATMPAAPAYSAVMAVYTLWLAARARGLGLGWISIVEPSTMATILDVPANWLFIGYFCLGHPECDALTPELESEGWEWRRSWRTTALLR
jgi:5,6-dimethylbenzimidazole synthase